MQAASDLLLLLRVEPWLSCFLTLPTGRPALYFRPPWRDNPPVSRSLSIDPSPGEFSLITRYQTRFFSRADAAWRGLRRAATGRRRARSSRLRPARQWILSIALVVLFGGLGWSALPAKVTQAASALSFRDAAANGSGIAAPVFVLRDSGVAVRFGNAELTPDGVIRVGFYDPLDPLLFRATEAISLPGDIRLLWLLASPEERQTLRDRGADLALALSHSMLAILRSPEFVADYRDRFVSLLRTDLRNAWQVTQQNGAWQELLRGYEPILRDIASRDLRPIVESHFRGVPMRMLRANALEIINPFGGEWNTQPVEDALQQAIQEIRDRMLPEQTASRLLDAPQTNAFLRRFLDALGTELVHDTALKDLVGAMVFDERLRPYLNEAIDQATEIGRVAPRLLVSLHGSTDLNPVAASVIRTIVLGRPDRVVVFVSPSQRDELAALDSASVHPLERMGPR